MTCLRTSMMKHPLTIVATLVFCVATSISCKNGKEPTAAPAKHLSAAEAKEIAIDVYVYGYPLVTMDYTRRVMTNVSSPQGTHAPMGQFVRARTYPNASFRDVTAPNADTLYTTTWLD